MAEKGSLSKKSERAKLNISTGNGKSSSSAKKELKNTLKNFGIIGGIILVVVLAGGVLLGSIVGYFVSRNDCFDMIGPDEVELTIGDVYTDPGVKIVEFGKDISDQVVRTGSFMELENGTSMEEGSFYIEYSVPSTKYSDVWTVHKIRIITFIAPSESDDFERYILNGDNIVNLVVGDVYEEAGVNQNSINDDEELVSTPVSPLVYTITIKEETDLVTDGSASFYGADNKVLAEAAGKTFVITYKKDGDFELTRTVIVAAQGGEG